MQFHSRKVDKYSLFEDKEKKHEQWSSRISPTFSVKLSNFRFVNHNLSIVTRRATRKRKGGKHLHVLDEGRVPVVSQSE